MKRDIALVILSGGFDENSKGLTCRRAGHSPVLATEFPPRSLGIGLRCTRCLGEARDQDSAQPCVVRPSERGKADDDDEDGEDICSGDGENGRKYLEVIWGIVCGVTRTFPLAVDTAMR